MLSGLLIKIAGFLEVVLFSFGVSWRASKKYLVMRTFLELFAAFLPFFTVFIGKEIIDFLVSPAASKGESAQQIEKFIWLAAALLAINVSGRLCLRLKEYFAGIHKELISRNINIQMTEQSAKLDLSYFDSVKFYNEINIARTDSISLQTLTWFSLDFVRTVIQITVSFFILLKLNPVFALILVVSGIPSAIAEKDYMGAIYLWQRDHIAEERKMNYILGIMTGRGFAKDVRLYGLENEMLSRYKRIWEQWFGEKRKLLFKKSIAATILSILPEIATIGMLIFVGINIISGNLTVGDYSLYTGMIGQLTGGLFMLIALVSSLYENNIRLKNYRKFLGWESNVSLCGTKKPRLPIRICFEKVSFKYPGSDNYILKDISFGMDSNEKIALVGLNGAGKSTIIKLILRFYDPTEGAILVNGIDIREYDLKEWRQSFSVMFQDYAGYAFTLRENVSLSDIENMQDEKKIMDALEKSGAENILNKFKAGLDTYLSREFEDGGEELSGGEWQKMALARTFFREGDIMILDEPSAALDPEAEHIIFRKFAQLCAKKGAIFISHRLANVTMADRIIVLENGTILEDGTHSELIEKAGKYSYLFNLQADKYRTG